MFITKTTDSSIKVMDARTGNIKFSIPLSGKALGNAQIQNENIVVQVQDGDSCRTKVYDSRTGNLKINLP